MVILYTDTLIQQGGQGQYDVCYIDADKSNYDTYYEQCLTLLRPLGMIVFDNVTTSHKFDRKFVFSHQRNCL